MNDLNKDLLDLLAKSLPAIQVDELQRQLTVGKIAKQSVENLERERDRDKHRITVLEQDKYSLESQLEKKVTLCDEQVIELARLHKIERDLENERLRYMLKCEAEKTVLVSNVVSKVFSSPVFEKTTSVFGGSAIDNGYGTKDLPYHHHESIVIQDMRQKHNNHIHVDNNGGVGNPPTAR